jgi:hypothetical protein
VWGFRGNFNKLLNFTNRERHKPKEIIEERESTPLPRRGAVSVWFCWVVVYYEL